MNNLFKWIFRLSLAMALLATCSLLASAQTAGYDLFQTGSGTSVDLSSAGVGVVNLQGVAIQGTTGNTDTIVHRTQDMPAGGGTVASNVNALFMKSTSSVTFNGQSADVYVTINNSGGTISTSVLPQPDSLSPSTGTVTIRTDGTFDSSITVVPDIIFVRAGTSVTNSANYLGHQQGNSITLTSTNSSWSSTPPSGYPSSSTYPSGGFYGRPVHSAPSHNHTVVPANCSTGGVSPASPQVNSAAGTQGGRKPSGAALARVCVTATAQ